MSRPALFRGVLSVLAHSLIACPKLNDSTVERGPLLTTKQETKQSWTEVFSDMRELLADSRVL